MDKALRLLAKFSPTKHDIMVFVDGDTVVPLDVVAQSAPWFLDPKVGALTTHEAAIVDRENLFKDWFMFSYKLCNLKLESYHLGRLSSSATGEPLLAPISGCVARIVFPFSS